MSPQIKPGAVIFAKDIDRVSRFYGELLPMAATLRQPDLIVLESDQFQLVIHPIPKAIARSIRIASPPVWRSELATKLVLPVASIAEARAKAPALGGELNPPAKEFEARGFRACDGCDPEGNVVQFRQPAG